MLLSDTEITALATEAGMITPFIPALVRTRRDNHRVLSYGLSSYGYDLRLSDREFFVFQPLRDRDTNHYAVVDPKAFNPAHLIHTPLHHTPEGDSYFVLPAHSYGLGVAIEHLALPADITALFIGKSTYARCGVIANTTPGEAGWHGHLTLEFSNSSDSPCRIYTDEGIVQALFFRGAPCATCYETRAGKYQDQPERVVTARI
jgi:dCTP deaminase